LWAQQRLSFAASWIVQALAGRARDRTSDQKRSLHHVWVGWRSSSYIVHFKPLGLLVSSGLFVFALILLFCPSRNWSKAIYQRQSSGSPLSCSAIDIERYIASRLWVHMDFIFLVSAVFSLLGDRSTLRM